MRRFTIGCAMLLAAACGKDETPGTDVGEDARFESDMGTVDDTSGPNNANNVNGTDADLSAPAPDTGDAGGTDDMSFGSCNRAPRAENGPRKVVVALPFTDTFYEVLDLSATGELSRPGLNFQMGAGHEGEIRFTPDGEVGYAVQDNGTLGVFRINAAGEPEVLSPALDPGFYVSGAVIDAAGDNLYAWETGFRKLDDGTANGALYRLPLGCKTGLPGQPEEVLRGKLIRGASWLSDTRLAVAAVDLLDDETPNDAHIVDLAGPTRVASVSAFADDDAIVAGFATTADGLFMLVGDNSVFSGVPNRIGVVGIQGDMLFAQQTFDIPDPVAVVTSPYDNAAIVLSTVDDNIYVLDYNPLAAVSAFSIRGPLASDSLLPLVASMVRRGDLEGLVLVSENVSIRRVRFEPNGDVTDLGSFALGTGIESIPGALGVQP